MPPPETDKAVEGVLDQTEALLEQSDGDLELGRLIEELGVRSMAAVLMVPALAVVSPLSGIPLFSSVCGLTIGLVAGQMFAGRTHMWLPQRLARRRIPAKKAQKGIAAMRGTARWLDRRARRRFRLMLRNPLVRLLHLVCMLCGLAMPFLEILPFTSSLLGAVVTLLAVSMLTADGLIALLTLSVLALGIGGLAVQLF